MFEEVVFIIEEMLSVFEEYLFVIEEGLFVFEEFIFVIEEGLFVFEELRKRANFEVFMLKVGIFVTTKEVPKYMAPL